MNMKSTKTKEVLYPQKLDSVRHSFSLIGPLMSAWVLYGQQSLLIERCYELSQGLHEGASSLPPSAALGHSDRAWQWLTKAETPAYLDT